MHVERGPALSPFPSFARLVTALALISLGCFSLHFSGFPFSALATPSFLVASWLFIPRAEWQRRLTARDYVGICAVLGAFAVLVLTLRGKEFPAFGRFMQRPGFLVPLWVLLCSGFVWRWRALHRTAKATSDPAVAA